MKEKLKIGLVGLGNRGESILRGVLLQMEDVRIAALCEVYGDRLDHAAEIVEKETGERPFCTDDYRKVAELPDVDAVIATTSWADHVPVVVAAMKAGKYAASEVGGAYSIDECWKLVHVSEETGIPCMMLENCCYGRDEMLILNMVRQGVLGEIMHCEGGYIHDLRSEVSFGRENRHYRLENYLHRNCENYPTHELGPIAKVLRINRGNRMLTLSSMASGAKGLNDYLKREKGDTYDLTARRFAQGDVVTTMISCAGGETIFLKLDTTLPHAYSRHFCVEGTKGMYLEDNRSIFIDGEHNADADDWHKQWNNVDACRERYDHPVWKRYLAQGVKGGHDGMDWLVYSAFVDAAKRRTQPPIDVYDMASWMAVSALSEQSVSLGGAPVAFPDFTSGRWCGSRKPADSPYALD